MNCEPSLTFFQALEKFQVDHLDRYGFFSQLSISAAANITLQYNENEEDLPHDREAKFTLEFKNEKQFDPGLLLLSHVLKMMFFMGTKEDREENRNKYDSTFPHFFYSATKRIFSLYLFCLFPGQRFIAARS